MPQMRKLSPEEVNAIENKGLGTRKLTEKQYDSIIAEYEPGEYGEAMLDEGENRLTVRNRLKAAASRRDLKIDFRRTSGDLIRFQINQASNGHAAPVEAPVAAKNKGGRPKAQDKGPIARLEEIAGKVQDAAKGALEDIGLREPAKRKGGRPKKVVA